MENELPKTMSLSPEERRELAWIALKSWDPDGKRGIPQLSFQDKLLATKLSDPPTPEEVKSIFESLDQDFFYQFMKKMLTEISRKYYPLTSKAVRNVILEKFPDVKPNEYRSAWRDNFPEFELQENWVASRLLWMVEWLNTIEFYCSGITPKYWMGNILGILEGRGWIYPGQISVAYENDHSMGRDE